MECKKTIIHWFRKGLRIHDNPSLMAALERVSSSENYYLRPIFVLDPEILHFLKVGPTRWRFLQQSLVDLDTSLRKLNTRLFVVRGNPATVFKRLFREWNVSYLNFEADIEPYALKRDAIVNEQASEFNVEVFSTHSHTIYNPYLVVQKNLGKPIVTYQKFLSLAKQTPFADPVNAPQSKLPEYSKPELDSIEKEDPKCYDCPTLDDLKVNVDTLGECLFPGGETESLRRLEESLKDESWVCKFEKPNTSPNSLTPSTTVLSPYLKFGCLSSRLFYKRLLEIYKKHKSYSKPPVSLEGQLMWREFYYCAAVAVNHFDQMEGNSICIQVDWDQNEKFLEAWTWGKTGYPFIDAIMRQLRQEGWIHHLARHAVACFLTRGDLWISWEKGQKVFEELLLDADWALNAGNWLWLSASAFFHQFFRVYSPVAFGKKTDPSGSYIRKYVPELKNYPNALIYEPWKASLKDQQEYKCVIGWNYPARIVIHEDVHKVNIGRMSAAYARNKNLKMTSNSEEMAKSKPNLKRKRNNEDDKNSPVNTLTKYFKKSM